MRIAASATTGLVANLRAARGPVNGRRAASKIEYGRR
jgi:hypothetical protein